jgi:hypothetical protein
MASLLHACRDSRLREPKLSMPQPSAEFVGFPGDSMTLFLMRRGPARPAETQDMPGETHGTPLHRTRHRHATRLA